MPPNPTTPLKLLLLCLLCLSTLQFDQINHLKQFMGYHEHNAQYVLLHVCYNRHFGNSRQFRDFLEVLEDVEYKVRDFCKVVLTDCEVEKENPFEDCKKIKENNENRAIVGMKPNDQFFTMGNKLLQRSPTEVSYNHPSDIYQVNELTDFLENLVPSFVSTVATQDQLKQFLVPRYPPKLLYFTKEQEVPFNLRKLSTHFHCRIDFAYIEDLSDDLVKMFKIHRFPTLKMLVYNYTSGMFDEFDYEGPQFDLNGYVKMKEFLNKFALKEPRTDKMFHTIHMPKKSQLDRVDNQNDLWRLLDQTPGWTLIQHSATPTRILLMKQKYGPYFSYIHHTTQPSQAPKLLSYLPRLNQTHQLIITSDTGFLLRTMTTEQVLSNVSAYAKQNYSVLIVRQEYGHVCAITEQVFFRGVMYCLILKEEEYEGFRDRVGGTEMKVGLYAEINHQEEGKMVVHKIDDATFASAYRNLEYVTTYVKQLVRLRIQRQTEDFFREPVKGLDKAIPLDELCSDPFKKCIIALMTPEKVQAHKTQLGYLSQSAKNYFQQFKFFWVNATCNKPLKQSIDQHKVSLFVYKPITESYTTLKTKLTKSNIVKFLKLAHREQLTFKKIPNGKVLVNGCLEEEEEL